MKKRILSLMLALAMMLSMASFSVVGAAEVEVTGGDSAKEAEDVALNTKYVVEVDSNLVADYYSFSADDDGFYEVVAVANKDVYKIEILSAAERVLASGTFYRDESVLGEKLRGGEDYLIRITYNGYGKPEESDKYFFEINYKRDDVGDEIEAAKVLSLGRKFDTELEGTDDIDWFTYTNDSNESKTVTIAFANNTGSGKWYYFCDESEDAIEIVGYNGWEESQGYTRKVDVTLESGQQVFLKIWFEYENRYKIGDNEYYVLVTEKQCEHKKTSRNNKVTEYEEIRGDENYHYIIKYYDEICDECKETVKSRVQESKYTERHDFSGSYCRNCDHEKEEEPIEEPIYTPPTTTVPAPVEDVIDGKTSFGSKVSTWAEEEMEEAYDEGLVPDVLVGENLTEKIDRAEFAAIAVQLYETLSDKNVAGYGAAPFNDIYGNDSYIDILKAYYLNITDGTSRTTFEPNKLITREQLATMLCRAIKKYSDSNWSLATDGSYYLDTSGVKKFADDADISAYAKQSVYFMAKLGVIKGVSSTHFAPKNTTSYHEATGYAMATREQAVAMSLRIFKISDMLK